MEIPQNLITLISIVATAFAAIVTPFISILISVINNRHDLKIKSLEKQHEILEYRKGTIIEFVEQNSRLASTLVSKLKDGDLNQYDIEKLYKLAFSSLLASRTQIIITDIEEYLASLHSDDNIEEHRRILSDSITDIFTYLSREISKLTRTQYEIMEELRETVSAPPKFFGFRRKDKQDSTQSQEANRYKKQDLYRSL
ncbi:hypothetical protein [Streptococcus pneumoniae]|uniref:hypothetical protein n=1 Tax=Streptococcus pneumoniae TaxID=1313 RepID=UPI0009DA6231|nr:hypothetical protein [Streptococcus pneumoniae]